MAVELAMILRYFIDSRISILLHPCFRMFLWSCMLSQYHNVLGFRAYDSNYISIQVTSSLN